MHILGTGIEASVLITSSLNLSLLLHGSQREQYQEEMIHRLESFHCTPCNRDTPSSASLHV